jgi:hypothetical protein
MIIGLAPNVLLLLTCRQLLLDRRMEVSSKVLKSSRHAKHAAEQMKR